MPITTSRDIGFPLPVLRGPFPNLRMHLTVKIANFSKKPIPQVIPAICQQHFTARKRHNLPDLLTIRRMIAMSWTAFARGLGCHEAPRSLHKSVRQELTAILAEGKLTTPDGLDIVSFHLHGDFLRVGVVITTVDVDKPSQYFEIPAQFFAGSVTGRLRHG